MRRRRRSFGFFLLPALVLSGCLDSRDWSARPRPWTASTVANEEEVRVERSNGNRSTIFDPSIGQDEKGSFIAGRVEGPLERVRIDLADVSKLEVREVSRTHLVTGIAAGIVVAIALVLFALNG